MSNQYWHQYAVSVTMKINEGSFGVKYDRQGQFTFCAPSAADARAIAGYHVKGATHSIDITRMVEIVGSVPIGDPYGR